MSKNTQLGNLVNGVYVDSSGKVGIGTQSPLYTLESVKDITYSDNIVNGDAQFSVAGATTRTKRMTLGYDTNSTNGFGYIKTGNQGVAYTPLYLNPASALAGGVAIGYAPSVATPPSSGLLVQGNVGIGTTSPTYKLEVTNSTSVSMRLNNTGDSTDSFIQYDNTGTSFSVGAGANGWFFYTGQTKRYDWWIANVIKLQLASNGNLLVGTTSDNGYKLNVSGNIFASSNIYAQGGIGSQGGIYIDYGYAFGLNSNTQNSANAWNFYVSSSFSNYLRFFYGGTGVGTGSAKFQIDTGGGYTGLSDINKKKDIASSTLGLAEVMQLKPSTFKFKDDENQEEQIGFIAQEVKDIIPQAYYEDKEGDDKFIGLKQNAFIPVLVKAIQELKAEIETLKNK